MPLNITSAEVVASGDQIRIFFDQTLLGASNGFTVKVNGATRGSTLAWAGNEVDLTVSNIASGDTVTLDFSTGSGTVASGAGNLASFTDLAVTNGSTQTRPTIALATTNTAGTAVTLTFDRNVNGSGSAFVLKVNGSTVSETASGSNGTSTRTLTLSGSPIAFGDTVTLDYSGSSIVGTTSSGMELAGFAAMPVVNAVPGTPPSATLQAQRTAWEVEPGYLPGMCGFDGQAATPFGDEASDVQNVTSITFVGLFRGVGLGDIIGTPVALPVEEVSETDAFDVTTTYSTPRPVGSYVPIADAWARTDTPLQGPSSNIADGEHYGLVRSINSQIINDGGTPATLDVVPRHRELIYARVWTDAAQANYVAMEADPARGWLHVSAEKKIKTYFAQSGGDGGRLALAFASPDHDVLAWRKLVALQHHGGRLACLAETDTEEFTLYLSGDGGVSITEELVMADALSALVFYVAARDWLVALWEDATTHQVKRKISLDGGETWGSATDCQYIPLAGGSLVDLEGTLQDKSGMPHAGGSVALVVTPPSSDTAMVLISQDGGSQWRQVL